MGQEDDILTLIDLIYETAFDSALWPVALTRLADTTGTAQVGLASLDRRAHIYEFDRPTYRSSHGREIQELLGLS